MIFSLVGGSMLLGFTVSLPLVSVSTAPRPQVKAAFTSAPAVPFSKSISPPPVSATGIYIVDLDSGQPLYAKNPNLRLQPASLTKIMTSLVAMDYYDQTSILTVKDGNKALGAKAELIAGDTLSAESLLYALLVPSGNDAALTLAENYPGNYQAFVAQMNSKVQALNLKNTHFSNVSGIDTPDHYTTAYDITQIAKTALKRTRFRNIVATRSISLKSEKGRTYDLTTTNELLGKPGILGIKTGWTPDAGECLITYAVRYGHPVLISLLGSTNRFGETEKLLDWVYSNYIWD